MSTSVEARPSLLWRLLQRRSSSHALSIGEKGYSWGWLRDHAEMAAGWLQEQGVAPGDRVVIHLPNSLEAVLAHLGCMALGAVQVPINFRFTATEVAPILVDTQPALALTHKPEVFAGQVTRVFPACGIAQPVYDWPATPGDTACWLFTSGTTGARPKGVPQTFAAWEANLDALAKRWQLSPEDCLWLVLPMFHTHGLVLGLYGMLLSGASLRLSERFEPVAPPSDCTLFYGVPTLYQRWLAFMRGNRDAFRHLRMMVSGSDRLPPELFDAVAEATTHHLVDRWGSTEGLIHTANPFQGERRRGSVGLPLDGMEVRIGEADELLVRGPSVMSGYQPPVADSPFTPDGWLRTGDWGRIDPDGYVIHGGRLKDLAIVGGENVSLLEVDACLAQVAGVQELACCALPDNDLNQVVGAAVVLDGTRPEDAVLHDLRAVALRTLSGVKRPRRYAVVGALPRTPLGKLQRVRIAREIFGVSS